MARLRPSPVRSRINSRSNSAIAANRVESSRPWALPVSQKRVAKRPERRAGLADTVDKVQQFTGRPAKPVELGHHDHVAELEPGHHLCELRSVGPDAADFLAVDHGGARGLRKVGLGWKGRTGAGSAPTAIAIKNFVRLESGSLGCGHLWELHRDIKRDHNTITAVAIAPEGKTLFVKTERKI
jgi:hypothetical protein